MEKKSMLSVYVKKTLARMRFEKTIYSIQAGLSAVLFSVVSILFISRFFVFPAYAQIAWVSACIIFVSTLFLIIRRSPNEKAAIRELDSLVPDNILITALDRKDDDSLLAHSIKEDAESKVGTAFIRFKAREKRFLNPRMAGLFLFLSVLLTLMILFPSEAQLEADAIEKEKKITREIKSDVEKLVQKEKVPIVRKELEELAEKLMASNSVDEALKELIKKQKEFRLKEQRLTEMRETEQQTGSPTEHSSTMDKQELKRVKEVADQLSDKVDKAHEQLSKIGKAATLPSLATTQNRDKDSRNGEGTDSSTSQSDGTDYSKEVDTANDDTVANQQPSDTKDQGKVSEQGQGQGQDQGQGKGEGQGLGGKGQGQGHGQGSGAGGLGIGSGSESRDLLSIPFGRIGVKSDSTIDSGGLGTGEFIEEREKEGLAEKGVIRPYSEVVGEYKDAYLKSTEKMKLPPDLQHILSDYFSSLE